MALKCMGRLRPILHQLRHTATPCTWKTALVVPQQDQHMTLLSRHFATKANKGKTKGHTPSRVNINMALVEDIINLKEVEQDMKNAIDGLKEDFNKNLSIRTSPGAFDHIIVKTKDGKFPLSHLGQITLKSPRLFVINMASFPESAEAAVNALRQSQMNLNPELDGTLIHVPVPPVTREHRENLTKVAKQLTNKAKDSVRKVRSGAVQDVKKFKSTVSEDTIKLIEKQIQQMADDVSAEIDKQLALKTKELLE
ncbi:ribosome-recycling factor, mitochondrial [Ranitomeya variabilis]|uniref:ribosome-recycling factor, mitochondrial n=1 Tax=Ranitomeya variabilis TaxID=490064 RepID=UPI00405685EE